MNDMTEQINPIIVEGARFVGKTYLISKVSDKFTIYKQKYAEYVNEFYSPEDKLGNNSDSQLFHYVAGSDITILDMHSKGLLKGQWVFDRLFLSNAVWAVQAGRLTYGRAFEYLDWIKKCGYMDNTVTIYIDAEICTDNRNKDQWNFYDPKKTREIYEKLIKYMKESLDYEVIRFTNMFTHRCSDRFNELLLQKC